jgi:hypothetical protein
MNGLLFECGQDLWSTNALFDHRPSLAPRRDKPLALTKGDDGSKAGTFANCPEGMVQIENHTIEHRRPLTSTPLDWPS